VTTSTSEFRFATQGDCDVIDIHRRGAGGRGGGRHRASAPYWCRSPA